MREYPVYHGEDGSSLNPCFNGICSMRWFALTTVAMCWAVLILVLMEYAQWASRRPRRQLPWDGLNPCFNGICSMRQLPWDLSSSHGRSLNPCFNGICSMSVPWQLCNVLGFVLILVLMEYAQWGKNQETGEVEYPGVLILVLMEYAQWEYPVYHGEDGSTGLNPCFNGICSMRTTSVRFKFFSRVLILVLMEYAQWALDFYPPRTCYAYGLNPCFNGICSMSQGLKEAAKTNSVS